MRTYLFYDIETSGLNKAFDQVLHFACIRTDMRLKELDRQVITIQLRRDVIMSPDALIVHRISPASTRSGICEYEAIQQIHQLLNMPGTISIGYNSLGFDDEFLRFSFYRNLLAPYTHQYSNNCFRMDLLPITVIFRVYKPDILNWPTISGKPTLKLEHISTANDLCRGRSHDAVVDVAATVALARRLMQEKEVWNFVAGYFDKETDLQRIRKMPLLWQTAGGQHRQGLLIASEYGPELRYQVPVLSIGRSEPYPNQTLWLRLDLPELQNCTPDKIDETTWVIRKRCGEPGIILPPLKRYWRYLTAERAALAAENLRWLKSNDRIFQQIIAYHQQFRYPQIPQVDVDAALYENGFWSREEEAFCRGFHAAGLEDKLALLERRPHSAVRQLAERIIFRNYSDNLPEFIRKARKAYLQRVNPILDTDILVDFRGEPRLTPHAALDRIRGIQSTRELDGEQQDLLRELEAYLQETFRHDSGNDSNRH